MSNRSGFLTFLIGSTALAAGTLAGAALWTVRTIHQGKKKDLLDDYFISPFELDVPHEEVHIVTRDSVVLSGWWFENSQSDKAIVGLTGRHGTKDELIGIGTGLWKRGYNVLIFDYRGRGQSEDSLASIGYFEQRDAEAALDYAMQRTLARHGSCRPAMLGYSMGASIALKLAAFRPEVEAVVADCPFSSLPALVSQKLSERWLPARWIMPVVDFLNRAFFRYSLSEVSPIHFIHHISPRPVFIIHAEQDRIIPMEDSMRLYEAAGEPRQLWLEPDADHCGAYFKDREAYIHRVATFFDEVFAGRYFS